MSRQENIGPCECCGGEGEVTECCPGYAVPDALQVTMSAFTGGASGLNGQTFPVDFVSVGGGVTLWSTGCIALPGVTTQHHKITLGCDDSIPLWGMSFENALLQTGCTATAYPKINVTSVAVVSEACDPLLNVYSVSGQYWTDPFTTAPFTGTMTFSEV